MHQMVLEFLTSIRASNTVVGMTSALHFATLQFLWSPIVDLFGRLRTWVWMIAVRSSLWGCSESPSLSSHGNSFPLWLGLGCWRSSRHARHRLRRFLPAGARQAGESLFVGTRIAAFRVARSSARRSWWSLPPQGLEDGVFSAAGALMLLTAATNALRDAAPDRARSGGVAPAFWRDREGTRIRRSLPNVPDPAERGAGSGVPHLLSNRRHHDVRNVEAVPARHRRRHRSSRDPERLQHHRVDRGSDRRRRDRRS